MSREAWRPCAVIPTYNNPATIGAMVERVRAHIDDVIVVDDASTGEARGVLDALARTGRVVVVRREVNGGKGAAVKTGLVAAAARGFTHALQIDADGQHDTGAIPPMLSASQTYPAALVLTRPVFAEGTPRVRRIARELTNILVATETCGWVARDAMIGCRIYPVGATLRAGAQGDRMDFDIEVIVRMVWAGTPVINLPVNVRYLSGDEGGVSHFRMWDDNLRMVRLHTRLLLETLPRAITGRAGWGRRIVASRQAHG